ncbi:MAG: hypothetical protein AB7F99_08125 [Vicinamibacterales bacterium]
MRVVVAMAAVLLGAASTLFAQEQAVCRFLCGPEFHVEPTVTFGNLLERPRVVRENGGIAREPHETDVEIILSLGLPTRVSWLEFTMEAIFLPFDREGTPELEFETNLTWLPSAATGGWVSSHFDIVDKFSAAERPTDTRAYTHKLNVELDTSVAVFNWLRDDRWLKGVEIEGSLDYVATGLPKPGDIVDDVRLVDPASPWSLSVVVVLPVAPW